jgi:hypothetical protein
LVQVAAPSEAPLAVQLPVSSFTLLKRKTYSDPGNV